MVKNCKGFWTKFKFTLLSIGLGQLLCLLLTSTGFTYSLLAKKGIDVPVSLAFSNYLLLALVYGGIMLHRREPFRAKFDYYIHQGKLDYYTCLGFFYGIGNLIVVRYTSHTPVVLLNFWTLSCVLLLTWFFFKTKYGFQKLAGVAICVVGLVTFVFSNVL